VDDMGGLTSPSSGDPRFLADNALLVVNFFIGVLEENETMANLLKYVVDESRVRVEPR